MTNTDPIFYSGWTHPQLVTELVRLNNLLLEIQQDIDNAITHAENTKDALDV